jgi:predicted phage baseplate assembly protein
VTDVITPGGFFLEAAFLSLSVGQQVAVTGVRSDKPGETASETVTIGTLTLRDGYTFVTFNPDLTGTYQRSTVTINANVAPATHGETTSEILGNGDATQTFQRFALKQPPLTYISAATSTGSTSSLQITVDGVIWTEVPWLYGSGPTDQVYTVSLGYDGRTYVEFGDGVTGARPRSGTNNIQANYRHGIGTVGLARAGQISTLMTRPLGLKSVTNPLASGLAADPDTVAQARVNSPISVKTIDRIVSLEDVGDFAAASAGIAKASSSWVWDGSRYVACATVAGVGGAPVVTGTDQYNSLLRSMIDAGDGTLPLILCGYQAQTFTVAATVVPHADLVGTDVLAAVISALTTTFSFEMRGFGQPVYSSEVIATMQSVPGVVAVTLDNFASTDPNVPISDPLLAAAPTLGPQGIVGAGLLTLQSGPLPGVVLAS